MIDSSQYDECISLYLDGATQTELQKKYSTNRYQIHKVLVASGVEIRSHNQAKLVHCLICQKPFWGKGNAKYCSDICGAPAKKERFRKQQAERWRSSSTVRDKSNARVKDIYLSIRHFVCAVKLTASCADCGYDGSCEALDLDHLFDKEISLSQCGSLKRVVEELAKGEVVCALCHRIRTESRREQKVDTLKPRTERSLMMRKIWAMADEE